MLTKMFNEVGLITQTRASVQSPAAAKVKLPVATATVQLKPSASGDESRSISKPIQDTSLEQVKIALYCCIRKYS